MNKVELSGTIVGTIDCSSEADGTEAARASLEFQRGNGLVKVFGFRGLARQFAQFKPGDQIRICGRLTVHPQNRTAAILVDEVRYFDARQECAAPSKDKEIRDLRHDALRMGKRERWR